MKKLIAAAALLVSAGIVAVFVILLKDVADPKRVEVAPSNSTVESPRGTIDDPAAVEGVWTVVGVPASDNVVYIDPDSISASGDIVKYRFSTGAPWDGADESEVETRSWVELDCMKYVDRTLETADYRDGRIIRSSKVAEEWASVQMDDDLSSHIYAFLCQDPGKWPRDTGG